MLHFDLGKYFLIIHVAIIFATVTTFFIINLRGECLSSDDESNKLIRSTAASTNVCDLYGFTANNVLKNFYTSKCVYNSNGRYLELSQSCNDINSIFQQTATGQLMHVNSGKCIAAVSSSSETGEVMLGNCDSRDKSLFRTVQGKKRARVKLFNTVGSPSTSFFLSNPISSIGVWRGPRFQHFSLRKRDFSLEFSDYSHL